MKRFHIVLLLVILFPCSGFSSEIQRIPEGAVKYIPQTPVSFKNYIPYAIDYRPDWGAKNFLFLSPEISKTSELYRSSDKQKNFNVKFSVLETTFSVEFDNGPSEDPGFFITSPALKEPLILGGETLFVSTSGTFYVSSRSNEAYTVKRKYVIFNGSLKEVKQPFYLVDMVCKT